MPRTEVIRRCQARNTTVAIWAIRHATRGVAASTDRLRYQNMGWDTTDRFYMRYLHGTVNLFKVYKSPYAGCHYSVWHHLRTRSIPSHVEGAQDARLEGVRWFCVGFVDESHI